MSISDFCLETYLNPFTLISLEVLVSFNNVFGNIVFCWNTLGPLNEDLLLSEQIDHLK